ncbi:serine protease [Streptomyces ruber]|uniref:Serine protease n=2 Tax=Streptomyces TaxID=1883 RepID=A0A918BB24_9ACTN|nr:alpha-lytic protease prodomain-containing protein [Streptomyces ruber]GGQ51164.1 serine protease [Streptomyces ruber]
MVHRHAVAGRRAALTVLGTLVLTGLPPAMAADPPPTPAQVPSAARTLGADRPSAETLRALQHDLGLTPDQAAARLVNEAEAGTRAGRLHNTLGTRFAGAWVGGTTSAELTVATTDAADAPAIEAQGAKAAVVRSSLGELRSVKAKLDAAAARVSTQDTPVWYVDVPANRVMVQATSRPAADAFLRAAGVPDRDVGVRVSATRPRALEDLRGGDGYYIENATRCSVGFSVMSSAQSGAVAADGTQGFVTAGHCGKTGQKTTGYNKTDLGTFQASTFPGKDMSWVGANSTWTPKPEVKGLGGSMVQVTGSTESLVGSAVCRSGSTTGWHCGLIEQHDVSVSYGQGTVDGLSQTTVCAEPGDSGGSFIAGSQAQGVTSGGSGDCTSGGTTYYQPVNPILQDFGLTLMTSTGSVETPAPQEGGAADSWATSRVYPVGATVTYGGVRYQCLQAHQAQGAWAPAGTPALWQRL